ncbi:lactonase family protein [Nostoc ellipsosporum NOK]|nr:lactonase family protein [Nostoc ellipsosporum NOK]
MKRSLLLLLLFPFLLHAQSNYLLVGTYTDNSPSKGIYVYKFNAATGTAEEVSHIASPNPSYLAVSPDERFVYAIYENAAGGNGGEIASFSFNKKEGTLQLLNKLPTKGDHPCYVETDRTGRWVFAGNYTSGSLSMFPVKADGSLDSASVHISHEGSGPDKKRQASPHVHCTKISPDNKFLYVADLGVDNIYCYAFDAAKGTLEPATQPYIIVEPGEGPRHITFDAKGKFAYLLTEMTSRIHTYSYQNGRLRSIQTIQGLPQQGNGGSAAIHLSPDGKFLYASHRIKYVGLVICRVGKDGKLTKVGYMPSGGEAPRDFTIDPSGKFLLAGNQGSNNIAIFRRNAATGLLTDTGTRIEVGKPVCFKWINAK